MSFTDRDDPEDIAFRRGVKFGLALGILAAFVFSIFAGLWK